jgi:hypothetical protein
MTRAADRCASNSWTYAASARKSTTIASVITVPRRTCSPEPASPREIARANSVA